VPPRAAIDAVLAAEGQEPDPKKSFLKHALGEKKDDFGSCFLVLEGMSLLGHCFPSVGSSQMCTGFLSLRLLVGCRVTVDVREVTCFDVIAEYYPFVPFLAPRGHLRFRTLELE
jgi:hypothetical protein